MIVGFLYIFAVLEVGYGIGVFLRSQDAILAPLAGGPRHKILQMSYPNVTNVTNSP